MGFMLRIDDRCRRETHSNSRILSSPTVEKTEIRPWWVVLLLASVTTKGFCHGILGLDTTDR